MKHQLTHVIFRLRNSSFIKNIFIVMSGTVIAQAIGYALLPLISRLFSPSDFGIFGSFNAVSGVIAAGVTLEYSQAIMLPKEKGDAINLFFVSCLVTIIITIICLVTCLLIPTFLLTMMKSPSIWILALLVFATLVSGFNVTLQAWCVRIKTFKQTSTSQVYRSLSSNSAQLGFGYFKGGGTGLIVSNILADIVASLNLLRVFMLDLKTSGNDINWDRMKRLAKEYRDFPMYASSQNVINALSLGLPVLLLTHFFGIAIAGAYTFGMRILSAPMGLILRALRQVLFQKACETEHQGGNLTSLYFKSTVGIFTLAFFPSLFLLLWAPQFFTWIFGSQWHTAGQFTQSLVLWMLFAFCNLPAVLFARLIRIQRTVFLYDLVLLAGRLSVLLLGGLFLTALQTITLFSLLGAIMNLYLIFLVGYNVVKKEGHSNWVNIRDALMEG
ncbi:MAG: oligosaccharide flippase family protein [Syntrophales bacterium]